MANYTTTSLEALKYLCSVINKTVDLPSTVISDTSIATNTTYSSFRLDKEFDTLEDELKHYTDTAIAGLNKLTKEIINDKSLVVKDNVLYLYKAADNPSNDYMQMMLINGVAVELGSTKVDFSNIYDKSEVDSKFAAKLDLDTLTNSVNDKIDKTSILTAIDNDATDEQVYSAKVVNTELDKKANDDEVLKTTDIATSISVSSTDSQVASAKVVYDNAIKNKSLKTYTSLSQLGLTTPTTVGEIFNAIPDGSLAVLQCADVKKYITDAPNSYGLLTIERIEKGRFSILFKQSLSGSVAINNFYIGQLQGSDGSGLTWSRVCTTKVADVNTPIIKNPTFPSNIVLGEGGASIKYVVRNGWVSLYMGFNIKSCNTTFTWTNLLAGLPLPANSANITLTSEGGKAKEPIAIRIISNGTLEYKIGTVITTEDWWTGNIIYPVAES